MVLQEKHWDPLLDWARSTFDVEINKFESLLYNSQPEATKAKFDQVLREFDAWEMAGELALLFFCDPYVNMTLISHGACYVHDQVIHSGARACEKAPDS